MKINKNKMEDTQKETRKPNQCMKKETKLVIIFSNTKKNPKINFRNSKNKMQKK